jgi:2-polyprenyl-6-hydroxyphenyl methylase/3-demethylubiquinone-9 3-methyltransferase
LWPHIVTLCAELGVRRVIDIGCGNGALCRELASRGYEVLGCEPGADGIRFALIMVAQKPEKPCQ